MAFPFCGREDGFFSHRVIVIGHKESKCTKVGHGYSHGSQPFHTLGPFIEISDKIIEQSSNFARNILPGEAIQKNCLENERTMSLYMLFRCKSIPSVILGRDTPNPFLITCQRYVITTPFFTDVL